MKGVDSNTARRGKWSIAARLTTFITLCAFAILLAGGLFLYWTLVHTLEAESGRFLADKVAVLRAIIHDRGGDRAALDEETRLEGAARRFNRYYVRILGTDGGVIIETPGMSELITANRFDTLHPEPVTDEEPREIQLGTRTLAVVSATALTTSSEDWTLQVAIDVSSKAALLRSYQRNLLIVLIAGLALAALAGHTIARRGLSPLKAITRATQGIGAGNLDQRISNAAWPRELTDLAAAFDMMLARLEDSFRRLSQFSADIAHELRTPITNFLTEAQVMLAQPRATAEYRDVLESGIEEFSSLARMIDALLFLAKAEEGQSQLERAALDARTEIDTLLEFHRADADEAGVHLSQEGDAQVFANRLLFQRAISNLLSNAVRHTPKGGRVSVRIDRRGDGSTIIRVIDSGSGIPAEHLPHLFDRFYRADPSRTHKTGGFGLGLALVQSIMTLHGGSAKIESEVGQGTRVALLFPPHS